MAFATAQLPRQRPAPLVLPPGQGNVLCRRTDDGGTPATGYFVFRGSPVRVEVPDPDNVLFPTDVGASLLAALPDESVLPVIGRTVLDVGAGSGLYAAALLAAGAAWVTALDVNPACAAVVRANMAGNGLRPDQFETVTVSLSDYRPAGPYDIVVTNPPHFPSDRAYARGNGLDVAAMGGPDGRLLYDMLVDRVDDLVGPHGTLVVAHSSLTDIPRTQRELAAKGYRCVELGVCELDLPLLAYEDHRGELMDNLRRLRTAGRAEFDGSRFSVHTLAFTHQDRPASGGQL